jgi:Protein of unknown function (DUF2490)
MVSGMRQIKKISVIVFTVLVIVFKSGNTQVKHMQTMNQVWLGFFNQTRFSNKWELWADFHLRTKEEFFDNLSQSVVRAGLSYYLTDAIKLTMGFAYVSYYPADDHTNVTQPEHRPWQQIQWLNKYKRIRTGQRVRLEERFRRKILNSSELASGYNFNYRVRYNFFLLTGFGKKGFQPHGSFFIVNDEVLLNFGKQIVYNYFDQNRFFLGFGYQTNKTDQIQIGYMNIFQQLSSGNQYKLINAVRIFYYYNLDLRKK